MKNHLRHLLIFLFLGSPIFAKSDPIIKNEGQINDESVLYYSRFDNWTVYFLKDRISFVKSEFNIADNRNNDIRKSIRWDLIPQWKDVRIFSLEKSDYTINYIQHNATKQISSYKKLKYQSSSFDILFYTEEKSGLKYDIIYHSNGIVGKHQISFKTEGCLSLSEKNNSIEFNTLLGNIEIAIPLSYTDKRIKNKIERRSVDITQSVFENSFNYEFEVKENETEIIIDPWASFIGGTDIDEAYGTAFDSQGNIYVSGYTSGIDFPVTPGVMQTTFGGFYDSFVFKFNPLGNQLWSTYYGGSNNDFGYKIMVNQNDEPILSGYTYSTDIPISASGVFASVFSGVFDAFILNLGENGSFKKATFYGGTGGEFVTDMDFSNEEIVITGFTSSMDLPVYPGAWQSNMGGALDIFVAKFDSTLNRIWDTYYGGTDSEDAHTVTCDPFGNVIIGGDTYSSDFPVSTNAYQDTYTAGSDICLIKFDINGDLIWSTFLGSVANEDCEALDCDEFGNIYFAGYATGNGLPITNGLFQDSHSGDRDLIFGSLSPGGNLLRMTFAGGTGWDFPRDILINDGGNFTITGESYSTDFPESGNTFQNGNNGNSDVIYIVSDSLCNVSLSTLWGGSGADIGTAIGFDNNYTTALTGITSSANLDVDSTAFQKIIGGQNDAFLKTIDSVSGVFLSIPDKLKDNSVLLYPNPVNNELIITSIEDGNYQITIYDISGKCIYSKNEFIQGQFRITSLDILAPGNYSILLTGTSKQYNQRFIKWK